ncbi:MAG: hypothetical protein U0838_07535 [Chloroflexota bacterium]
MSPSEIGFLALGVIIGIAAGVMLLAVVRPRSPLRPVVKVTVTPHAMTPRDGIGQPGSRPAHLGEFAPGSPDEEAHQDRPDRVPVGPAPTGRPSPASALDVRTRVPSGAATVPSGAVAIPVVPASRPASGPMASGGAPVAKAASTAVAVAERPAPRLATGPERRAPLPMRVDVGRAAPDLAVRARPPVPEPRPRLAPTVVGVPIVAARSGSGGGSKAAAGKASTEPCGEERTTAASACAAADVARDAARAVADRLRDAQRAHADLQARVEEAGALADPRRLAAEKDRLHVQFKASQSGATTADAAEAAAREWLTAVSAANTASQDAARRVQHGTDELRSQAAALEKLDLEASAARIAAERAEASCRSAREALAACEERQRPASPDSGDEPSPRDAHWPGTGEPSYERVDDAPASGGQIPVILRVLRGDHAAREQLVAELAAGDAAATAAWHVRIAKFVDAVIARAIEDGYIDTAEEQPFWRLFSMDEQHDIISALSSLGFRFDGMRGFVDDRAPSARDLSLAVGYAGLDRMRIRTWPSDADLAALFEGAVVRADLWIATQTDDLALARMEAALGSRAAGLSELWDAWGRVRPAMLDER